MAAPTTTIRATIARVNGHGFQTREDPGKWWNVSKYASPAPAIPPTGADVLLTIDASGFVRAIELAGSPAPTPAPLPQPAAPPALAERHGSPPDRETVIVRLACLKAAARYLNRDGDADSDAVTSLAGRWEAWTLR